MECMSYSVWKYPNTSRKIAKLLCICMMVYLIIYFLFLDVRKRTIQVKDLQTINGTVQSFEFIRISKRNSIPYLQLREYSNKFFAFDRGAEYAPLRIQNGDLVEILVSKEELAKNSSIISGYELKKGETFVYSVDKYNTSLRDDSLLANIFLWVAFIYIVLYLLMEKLGLFKWLQKQLASPDPNFQSNKPNFNEFEDR